MKRTHYLIIITLLYSSQLFAQVGTRDGYIITLGNDTLYGRLYNYNILKIGKPCRFINDNGTTEYTPSQIKGFGFINDKYYSSQLIENTFLQVLIQGDLSLYKNNLNLFIQKKGQEVIKLESREKKDTIDGKFMIGKDNTWIGLVSILVFDCIQDIQKVQNLNLNERDLSRLVIDYNKCKGTYYKDYLAQKPWTKIELGFSTGLNYSSINIKNADFRYNYLDDGYQSFDPTFGLFFTISSPRFMRRIAFQSEVQVIKSDFYSEVINTYSSGTNYHDTYIDLTTLSVPLSIRYTLSDGQYNLYVNGGINYINNLKWHTWRDSEQLINNTVFTSNGQAFAVNKQKIGLWCGVGFIKSFNSFKGGLTLRYNWLNKLNLEEFVSNMNSISLSLIITTK